MTVSVVTPWFNHVELWDDYKAAVSDADEVVIVDDGSAPPLEFAIVRLEQNSGFSRASNAGLAAATGDKVVFLNNDIYATDPDWLEAFTTRIEPGVLAGAKLRTEEHARVQGIIDPLPYLDGWCLGGMRDDFETLGGWEDGFTEPAYFSDNDLCLRARCLGMTLRECRVGIHHKLSQTNNGQRDVFNAELQTVMAINYRHYSERARMFLGSVAA